VIRINCLAQAIGIYLFVEIFLLQGHFLKGSSNNPYARQRELHNKFHELLGMLFAEFSESRSKGLEDVQKKFTIFRSCLYTHMKWEESILYPMLEADMGEHKVTSKLRKQNLQLRELVRYVDSGLKFRKAQMPIATKYENNLWELLKAHWAMEDDQLFPLVERYIEKGELDSALDLFPE